MRTPPSVMVNMLSVTENVNKSELSLAVTVPTSSVFSNTSKLAAEEKTGGCSSTASIMFILIVWSVEFTPSVIETIAS